MAGINKVILVGNLGNDPNVLTFENGVKKATFSLATNETYKDKEGNRVEQTEWHNIVVSVSYTHLRAHETPEHLVCRLLLEKKTTSKSVATSHTKDYTT